MNKKERTIPNEIEMEKILERRYKDIPTKSISATPPEKEKLNTDFSSASKNFWLENESGKYYQKYNEGFLSGTYNTRKANFKSISDTILEAIKNVIRSQCEEEDRTLEEFNIYLEMLEKSFELMSNKLDSSLSNKIDGEMMMAYLHAVFNSFIKTNIK